MSETNEEEGYVHFTIKAFEELIERHGGQTIWSMLSLRARVDLLGGKYD